MVEIFSFLCYIWQVSFHPIDAGQIFLTGNHLCRSYSLVSGRCAPVNPNPYQRCESLKIICHCWLTVDQILLGLDPNSMCTMNTSGDLLQRYDLWGGTVFFLPYDPFFVQNNEWFLTFTMAFWREDLADSFHQRCPVSSSTSSSKFVGHSSHSRSPKATSNVLATIAVSVICRESFDLFPSFYTWRVCLHSVGATYSMFIRCAINVFLVKVIFWCLNEQKTVVNWVICVDWFCRVHHWILQHHAVFTDQPMNWPLRSLWALTKKHSSSEQTTTISMKSLFPKW